MVAIRRVLQPALGRLVITFALAVGLCGVVALTAAPRADAAVTSTMGVTVVKAAATRKGVPYRAGGSGPRGFDCSGYTKWAYARVGKSLPRTSNAQYRVTVRIGTAQRRAGDLVFFFSGSRISHVGIYAGGGKIWHSPKRGDRVKLSKIWTSKVRYARVR